ncbi:DUF533 domain-containing protein [Loktanella sp. DSM 29012]|uniref:DUF533 domain-containing protein n=1 Tax=Loktanella sp. DSM 29012 TaxID=1881056 RepID=UPI001C4346F1|nr:DUF533 domain-containing protein [Loktanella sp. DSM 29012]
MAEPTFDAIQRPFSPGQIAALAVDCEQAAELYPTARVATDRDEPAEKTFLRYLSEVSDLPAELVVHLETWVASDLET